MKTLFFTTQTPHHAYFVQEVIKIWPDCRGVLETTGVTPPFDISHSSDAARDAYEIDTVLGGQNVHIADMIETISTENINDDATARYIETYAPDIIIDFGTRRVKQNILDACTMPIVNLHGGDPEHYRGLDSHMWAMYHNDFAGLVTTLHVLNAALDDGGVIDMQPIAVHKNMKIHEFRKANTDVCIKMVLDMLNNGIDNLSPRTQTQKGRYYSFMPSVLKTIAAKNFEKYTAALDG